MQACKRTEVLLLCLRASEPNVGLYRLTPNRCVRRHKWLVAGELTVVWLVGVFYSLLVGVIRSLPRPNWGIDLMLTLIINNVERRKQKYSMRMPNVEFWFTL